MRHKYNEAWEERPRLFNFYQLQWLSGAAGAFYQGPQVVPSGYKCLPLSSQRNRNTCFNRRLSCNLANCHKLAFHHKVHDLPHSYKTQSLFSKLMLLDILTILFLFVLFTGYTSYLCRSNGYNNTAIYHAKSLSTKLIKLYIKLCKQNKVLQPHTSGILQQFS